MLRLLITVLLGNTVLRLYGFILYPLAYALRSKIRLGEGVIENTMLHKWYPLWLVLDDSVYITYDQEWNKADKPTFLQAWYWSAIRNSCVNYWNYNAVGGCRDFPEGSFFKNLDYDKGKRFGFQWYKFGYRVGAYWSSGTGRLEIKGRKV